MNDDIEVDVWIVVEQRFKEVYGGSVINSGVASVRCTKTRPVLQRDEVPVKLRLKIPRAYWIRPAINATVTLPPLSQDAALRIEVGKEIGERISQEIGMRVDLTVLPPAPEGS